MDACRRHGPQGLFRAEGLFGKVQQSYSILGDQIGCYHAVSARNRAHTFIPARYGNPSALGALCHAPHATVHLLDGHFFRQCRHTPRVSKGILKRSFAASVKLIGDGPHGLGPCLNRMGKKLVYVGNTQ